MRKIVATAIDILKHSVSFSGCVYFSCVLTVRGKLKEKCFIFRKIHLKCSSLGMRNKKNRCYFWVYRSHTVCVCEKRCHLNSYGPYACCIFRFNDTITALHVFSFHHYASHSVLLFTMLHALPSITIAGFFQSSLSHSKHRSKFGKSH